MNAFPDSWQGLGPELEKLDAPVRQRMVRRVPRRAMVAFVGGYEGQHWRMDRRPQPLRSRRSVQHLRTILRRRAVTRLKTEGLSFRQISRKLVVSHVAVWKLWRQVVDDVIDEAAAVRIGWERLEELQRLTRTGDTAPFGKLIQSVTDRFGVRACRRLVELLECRCDFDEH